LASGCEEKLIKNDIFYGVKLGSSILHHAEEKTKTMVKKPPSGSFLSLPQVKFHADISDEVVLPKEDGHPATAQDIVVCRASHHFVEDDTFQGDDGLYSSKLWAHDLTIGFSHTGGGWKNREFCGHLYGWIGGIEGFESKELNNEFWSTPSSILADSANNTVWIHADQRIKGFSIDQTRADPFYTSYIFNITRKAEAVKAGCQSFGVKRQKLEKTKKREEGQDKLIVFGSRSVGYLSHGVLQQWDLTELNAHDGAFRMICMDNVEEDVAQFNKEDILNLSENTWMGE